MKKEKQDRFECRYLECNMDGCYCGIGHGSIRGYGHCVIPFEQESCKYFERGPKPKTVKITENEVVISKEEKQKLLKEMYEQGKFDAIADLEKEGKVVIRKEEYKKELQAQFNKGVGAGFNMTKFKEYSIRKKTAEKILTNLKPLLEGFVHAETGENLYVNKCKQYGVDLGEEE